MNSTDETFRIFCIILTYGDRFEQLKRVVDELLYHDVEKIIIVDNNSTKTIYNKIREIIIANNSKISVINFERNIGTAKALSAAFKLAYGDKSCDFISILDDDNLISVSYFENLKSFWVNNELYGTKEKVMLSGFRMNKSTYVDAIQNNYDWIGLNDPNNYWGFHLKDIVKIVLRRLSSTDSFNINKYKTKEVNNSAWGGMFFHKSLIDKIGLPNEDYFIFLDDYEFSHRIKSCGGKIFLLLNCLIKDIDCKSYSNYSRFTNLIRFEKPERVYYAARNHFVYGRKFRCNSVLFFYMNVIVFIKIVFFFSLFNLNFSNFKRILIAIFDGINGNLGENKDFALN